ncbi:MAG: N-formylglutamate deformylase [Inquilinus sp.]|nr:N-formylglutamate deformylase [Inquilinus sp.]
MQPFHLTRGSTPLLVSVPHAGIEVPDAIAARFTEAARALPDTDWHVDRLYDMALELGAGLLAATHSRYVIDLNRDPDGTPLYPGADNTELCPTSLFDGGPLYRDGAAPDADEVTARRDAYWKPYHAMLAAELDRLKRKHGYALLYDAHSIRGQVPRFFEGTLPDLNIGTGGGKTADPALTIRLTLLCQDTHGYETAVNGRFKGGYITRRYGDPAAGIHAVQMELAQSTYMDEDPPYAYDEEKADRLRPLLRRVLEKMLEWGARKYGR